MQIYVACVENFLARATLRAKWRQKRERERVQIRQAIQYNGS